MAIWFLGIYIQEQFFNDHLICVLKTEKTSCVALANGKKDLGDWIILSIVHNFLLVAYDSVILL